ncbi:MAG: 3-dehydroquinate synthase, partial [Bacteroidetes bacterium]|nr:3-dehydroquinate synthase [Bacteroidota bacterium]
KHAAIADAAMFTRLAKNNIKTYQRSKLKLSELIRRNVLIKSRIVKQDPFEKGPRRLLNFGHTLGHALENQYELSHGEAIAIGMAYAAVISEKHGKFRQAEKLISLLDRYGLPAFAVFDQDRVMKVLKMDKKRASADIHYVMLERIGKGMVQSIPLKQLLDYLKNIQA